MIFFNNKKNEQNQSAYVVVVKDFPKKMFFSFTNFTFDKLYIYKREKGKKNIRESYPRHEKRLQVKKENCPPVIVN